MSTVVYFVAPFKNRELHVSVAEEYWVKNRRILVQRGCFWRAPYGES